MSEDRELLACPFCGGAPEKVGAFSAQCRGMANGKEVHNTIVMNNAAWNARPPAIGVEAVAWATCQDCGGVVEGWICQSCGREFEENDAGYLVFAAPSTIQTGAGEVIATIIERAMRDGQGDQDIIKLATEDILAALPSVPVGGLGAWAAPIPTEGHDAAVVVPLGLLEEAEGLLWLEGYEATAQLLNHLTQSARQQAATSDDTQPGTSGEEQQAGR